MRYIKLTCNKYALVDDSDFEWLNQVKWTYHQNGYAYRQIENRTKCLLMHRIILRVESGQNIDHINHNGLDNRKKNLRLATQSQNMMNKSKQSNNKSGFIGVYFNKTRGYFQAYIKANKKHIYLGKSNNAKELANKYKEATKHYFGEFAYA